MEYAIKKGFIAVKSAATAAVSLLKSSLVILYTTRIKRIPKISDSDLSVKSLTPSTEVQTRRRR